MDSSGSNNNPWQTEYKSSFNWKTVFQSQGIRKPFYFPPSTDETEIQKTEDEKPRGRSTLSLSSRFRKLSNYREVSEEGDKRRKNQSPKKKMSQKPLKSSSKKIAAPTEEEPPNDPEAFQNILTEAHRTLQKKREIVPPRDYIHAEQIVDRYSNPFQTEYKESYRDGSLLKELAVIQYTGSLDNETSTDRLSSRFRDISLDQEEEDKLAKIVDERLKARKQEKKTLKKLKKLEERILKQEREVDEGLGELLNQKDHGSSRSRSRSRSKAVFKKSGKGRVGDKEHSKESGEKVSKAFDFHRTFSVRRDLPPSQEAPPKNIFLGVSNASVSLDAFPTFKKIALQTVKPAAHREKRHFPQLQALDQTVKVFHPESYEFRGGWNKY